MDRDPLLLTMLRFIVHCFGAFGGCPYMAPGCPYMTRAENAETMDGLIWHPPYPIKFSELPSEFIFRLEAILFLKQ